MWLPAKEKYSVIFALSPPSSHEWSFTSFFSALLRMCFSVQIYIELLKQIRNTHSQWHHKLRNPNQKCGCGSISMWVAGGVTVTSLGPIPISEFFTPLLFSLHIYDGLFSWTWLPARQLPKSRVHRESDSPSFPSLSHKGKVVSDGGPFAKFCLRG